MKSWIVIIFSLHVTYSGKTLLFFYLKIVRNYDSFIFKLKVKVFLRHGVCPLCSHLSISLFNDNHKLMLSGNKIITFKENIKFLTGPALHGMVYSSQSREEELKSLHMSSIK